MAELVDILKSLSDETRFKLIRLLLCQDFCVGALARRMNISESAVSQHLKVLRKAGLVKGDKRGYFTHYYVDRTVLKEAAGELFALTELTYDESAYLAHNQDNKECCGKEEE